MDIRDLIELADIKERQALALLTHYIPKLENNEINEKEVQENIDNYCDNMAETFLENHKEDLKDKQLNWQFGSYLLVKGADKPHSGYRFYEALYRKMSVVNKDDEEIEEKNNI